MKRFIVQGTPIDFEKLGYETRLRCPDRETAQNICGLTLHAYEGEVNTTNGAQQAEWNLLDRHARALHAQLYDRHDPVNDAEMLVRGRKMRLYFGLACLAAAAALAGNAVTFVLYGYSLIVVLLLAMCTTLVPAVVGHLAFEKVLAQHKRWQAAVALLATVLCLSGLLLLSQARLQMVDKATAPSAASSYVDGETDTQTEPDSNAEQLAEAKIQGTVGQAMRLIAIGVDVILGLLVGLLGEMRADPDCAAWTELAHTSECMTEKSHEMSERAASVEIAKMLCMSGILRAESELNRRHPPYHALAIAFLLIAGVRVSSAQKIDHYEGILIDTSSSITRGGANRDLFQEYLRTTKQLLITEPTNSRVWVSSIATDSFGGVREIVKGWTPGTQGVFTADLNRARRQLAASFEAKSASLKSNAQGTDIFGGLWHLKTLFDSATGQHDSAQPSRTSWIFSDMMNETPEFDMPQLIAIGPERMLERARAQGLMVPLRGYEVHVQGASPSGLTPQQWLTIRKFWEKYFSAAGAKLKEYSSECDITR